MFAASVTTAYVFIFYILKMALGCGQMAQDPTSLADAKLVPLGETEAFISSLLFVFPSAMSILKKSKRLKRNHVDFDRVTVFYFQRCQGFTSVPSRGGCTLGMLSRHSFAREFTLAEFSKEQEVVRREKLKERLKEEKLEALKWKVSDRRR